MWRININRTPYHHNWWTLSQLGQSELRVTKCNLYFSIYLKNGNLFLKMRNKVVISWKVLSIGISRLTKTREDNM